MSNTYIPAISSAYLILTENCNLRCTYCFEKDTRAVSKYMSKETAFKAVDFLFEEVRNKPMYNKKSPKTVNITFFGGEPMLCPELMMDIMNYCEEKKKEDDIKVNYAVITNGTIYNEKIEEFLDLWRGYSNNNINIQLSIDGIPEIQNKNRPCAMKSICSSDLIKEAVKKYKEYFKKYNINPDNLHIHACVSKESIKRLYDSYVYFTKELGIQNSNFAWVIEENWDDSDLVVLDNELGMITSRLSKMTTNQKRFPFKHFDKCSGCSSGRNLVAFDTEGNIYPCHRFFFYDKDKRDDLILGNIFDNNGIDMNKRQKYLDINHSKISSLPCQVCVAVNYEYCNGDMYKLPSDYPIKFMYIINKYYDMFVSVIEKKSLLEAIKNLNDRLEIVENKINKEED